MNSRASVFPPGKAVIFNGPGKPFEFIETELPPINKGEVLVKTLYTTICGSDIHTFSGRRQEPPNVVLGHEIVGEILWIDPAHPAIDQRGTPLVPGDRITWSIFAVPANVQAPRADIPQKSEQLFKYGHTLATCNDVFNGGLAEYCILRANTALLKIATEIPLKVAATISCAHATVAGALRVAGMIENRSVIVFGAGLLGLSCLAMCREAGALSITLIDTDASRLQWGKKFGADKTSIFNSAAAAIPLLWPEADLVFDMTGQPDAMKAGIDSLALGGTAIWIGAAYPAKPVPVDAQKIVRKILTIKGLHNYNYQDFEYATTFIEHNYLKYPFEELVEKEFELHQTEEAFKYASEYKPVRVGIKIN